jgi:hypothetical protein
MNTFTVSGEIGLRRGYYPLVTFHPEPRNRVKAGHHHSDLFASSRHHLLRPWVGSGFGGWTSPRRASGAGTLYSDNLGGCAASGDIK